MNAVITAAVAAVVKEKQASEAKKSLEPGRYEVDAIVHVQGDLTKGADYEQKVSDKLTVDWKLLAAMFANKLNKETRNMVAEDFIRAMDHPEELAELTEEIKVNVERKIGKIKNAAERVVKCSGKVTTNLSVDTVGQPIVKFVV